MPRTTRSSRPDPYVQKILRQLSAYQADHPKAKIDVYRRNSASVRIRIIDPDFKKLDRVDRNTALWAILDGLPDDVQQEISLLLLYTPEEAKRSLANIEFENPTPSEI